MGSPTIIQFGTRFNPSSFSIFPSFVTLPNPVLKGDLIIVMATYAGMSGIPGQILGYSDNQGNTYTLAYSHTFTSSGFTQRTTAVYYTTASASGSLTVTEADNSYAQSGNFYVLELPPSTFTVAGASGNGTSVTETVNGLTYLVPGSGGNTYWDLVVFQFPNPLVNAATASALGLLGGQYLGLGVNSLVVGNNPYSSVLTLQPTNCLITVNPSSLTFQGIVGSPNPPSQTVSITNVGTGGAEPFTVSTSASWLSASPTSGNTDATVTISVNISGLTPGTYSGTITIGTGACGTGTITANVILVVQAGCVVLNAQGQIVSTYFPDLCMNIAPATELYKNVVPNSQITAYETYGEGRPAIVMDFNQGQGLYARDLGTIFTWNMTCRPILRVWQPSLIEQPEGIYGRGTDWDDGGSPGNKFFQGVIIEADTFNVAKTFFLQDSDTLNLHALNECPEVFNGQSVRAFSCVPFTAHSCRVISTDGVEWRIWSARLVFQPWPEATLNWQTELTSFGMVGWAHAREANIPYVSTTQLTLVLTFDAWPAITLFLPSSNGVQVKTKVTLPPNKWKLMGLQIFSTEEFNLFASDMELKVGAWGRTGPYEVLKPFGGKSSTGAIV